MRPGNSLFYGAICPGGGKMTESKFYWLKLQRDFFKRSDIMVVENMPNGKEYVLFYLKLLLERISHKEELV